MARTPPRHMSIGIVVKFSVKLLPLTRSIPPTGLGVVADGPVSSEGTARAPKFTAWVTERQKERANILKQHRLYAEEQEEQRKRDKGKGKGKDKDNTKRDKKQKRNDDADE